MALVTDSVGWTLRLVGGHATLHGDGQAACRPPHHLAAATGTVGGGALRRGDEAIQDVTVLARPALAATAIDVLGADGYLLGTPANLGYMSGALKHFLDQIYYPCLEATVGRPYGLYVHGDSDTTGAVGRSRRSPGTWDGGVPRPRWPFSATRTGRTSRRAGSLAPRWRPA